MSAGHQRGPHRWRAGNARVFDFFRCCERGCDLLGRLASRGAALRLVRDRCSSRQGRQIHCQRGWRVIRG